MIIGEMFFKHFYVLVALLLLIFCTGMKPALGSFTTSRDGGVPKVMCVETERQALLEFKRGLIDDYGRLSSWGVEEDKKDCCKWRGVRCSNRTGHVMELDLYAPWDISGENHLSLRGKIRPSLLELQHLKYLDLSWNDFSASPIPEFIGSFSRLQYLNLSYTEFPGTVPTQFGNLSELRYLDLGNNYGVSVKSLEWVSHLSLLRYLNMDEVNLRKAIDWTEATNKLPLLTELHLNDCHLPGIISPQLPLINSSVSLAVLHLSENSLNSSIYNWLFNFNTSLVHVDLSGNSLQGPLPDAFGNLNSLANLDLSSNQLEGQIPKSFGNLNSLANLYLFDNELEGQIPKSFGNLNSLANLDLSSNQLEGQIPKSFGNLNSLANLDLSGNQLEGQIPKSFGNLSSLRTLDLSYNKLTGQISEFVQILCGGAVKPLEILHLGSNQLGGSLPDSITRFSSLKELYLNDNQLNGSLPNFTGLFSLRELYLSYNRFIGPLPKSIGQLFMLEFLDVSSNSLDGTVSEAHLSNLNNLQRLDLSFNSLALDFNSDWNPPSQLDVIKLRSCRLGPRFPNWLQTQTNYSVLDISNSSISDVVPEKFWDLSPRLSYLNLSYNQLNGKVPDLSLKTVFYPLIDLSSNRFECPIAPFPPNVTALYLSKNKFFGSIFFLCNLNSEFLRSVDLSFNRLSGELPDCWMHMQNLVILNLANNNFFGKIPQSMGFLNELKTLHLRHNNLVGELPSSLKNCGYLRIFDLGENKLSGEIPTWIGTHLKYLVILSLRLNKFHGYMPVNICHLNSIQILDLSHNNISGIIPQCVSNFTALVWRNEFEGKITYAFSRHDGTKSYILEYEDNAIVQWKRREFEFKNSLALLKSIDLSDNRLVGKIPEEISSLTGLSSLNLSGNYLTGHIIQKIGELKMLESLDLSRNQLFGKIPTSITHLNFLAILDLSNNNLSGKIPSSTQLQSFDASAYAGNHELCGLPLPNKCPGDETTLDPSITNHGTDNIIQGDEDGFINREFYVSMGLGFGIGFGAVFGTLLLQRSWEYVFFELLNNIKDWLYVTTAVNMARARSWLQS